MLWEMKLPCRLFLSLLFLIAFVSCPVAATQAQGIDVSKYQGNINWKKVSKSKKVKFVYIRATEGTSIRDPRYKANVDSARKYKIYVGSYHVYSSKTTAYQQFANFKSVVSKKKQDLIPVLDIEGYHSGNLNMARVNKLLELMEKEYGAKPMIYTSEKVYREHFSGKRYRSYHIFVAKYKGTPSIRYTLWQHSKTGRISGISGDVDLDKFHKKHSLYDLYLPKHRKKKETKKSDAAKTDSSKSDTKSKPNISAKSAAAAKVRTTDKSSDAPGVE